MSKPRAPCFIKDFKHLETSDEALALVFDIVHQLCSTYARGKPAMGLSLSLLRAKEAR